MTLSEFGPPLPFLNMATFLIIGINISLYFLINNSVYYRTSNFGTQCMTAHYNVLLILKFYCIKVKVTLISNFFFSKKLKIFGNNNLGRLGLSHFLIIKFHCLTQLR